VTKETQVLCRWPFIKLTTEVKFTFIKFTVMTASFSFVDHYQILHEKDLAFSQEHLNGDDKENQEQPKKKPRKVSGIVIIVIW